MGTCTKNTIRAGSVPAAEPTQYTPDIQTQPRPHQPCRRCRLNLSSSVSSINSNALQTQNQETDCAGQRHRISEQRSHWRGSPGGARRLWACYTAKSVAKHRDLSSSTKGFLALATWLITTGSLVHQRQD